MMPSKDDTINLIRDWFDPEANPNHLQACYVTI